MNRATAVIGLRSTVSEAIISNPMRKPGEVQVSELLLNCSFACGYASKVQHAADFFLSARQHGDGCASINVYLATRYVSSSKTVRFLRITQHKKYGTYPDNLSSILSIYVLKGEFMKFPRRAGSEIASMYTPWPVETLTSIHSERAGSSVYE